MIEQASHQFPSHSEPRDHQRPNGPWRRLVNRIGGLGADWLARRIDRGLASGQLSAGLPDGSVRIMGARAQGFDASMTIVRWRALIRIAFGGSVGIYQAWELGEWTSNAPETLFALFMANARSLGNAARARGPWRWIGRLGHGLRRNTRRGARRNIHAHYDLGNDFYAAWLDPDLVYSSARFAGPGQSLAEAQHYKLQTIANRIGDARDVLEIGCGWGALAQELHDRGRKVTAISLSPSQLDWARAHRSPDIDFRLQDYRDASGQFDAIVSVEMVEAVGQQYWADFLACIARCLRPGGLAAIQYIAIREDLFEAYARGADFIQTYIFPGGMLISQDRFRRLAHAHGLDWLDEEHFAPDYAQTLRIWRGNFEAAIAERRLPEGFDERFQRLWRFYLMYCEGGFAGSGISVAQVTLKKP